MKKNLIYSLGAVLIWSTLAPTAKMMLNGIPNMQMLSICSIIGFLFLLVYNTANGSIKTLRDYRAKDFLKMSGLGFLGMFMSNSLYYYGISQMTSQEACILNYLWPIMILIFSCIILRERVTAMKVVAIVCSFLGIVILSLGTGGESEGNIVLGIIATIINAVCYGLFSVLNKKADLSQNITMMVIWLTTGICAGITGLCTETWVPISGVQWIGMVWLGIAVNATAYLLWALGLKKADDSAKVANLAYLTPFLSLIVAYFMLGERIAPRALIALVFIIGGILLQYFWDHRRVRK